MAVLLKTDSISKSFGIRTLFRGISLSLDDQQHVGLIGPNGSGKSTLLKILAGLEHADTGAIESRRNLRLGYLPQEDTFPAGQTVHQVVQSALQGEAIDDREKLTRVQIQLGKMGFQNPDAPADTLSG